MARSVESVGKGGYAAALAFFAVLLFPFPSVSVAASTATMSVSATVLSKSVCRFASKSLALNFGTIDPGSPADATATATIGFRCGGSSSIAVFAIVSDTGLHGFGGFPRMQHGTIPSEFLPYFLGLNPSTGSVPKNTNQTLTVTGTVRKSDFQNASSGTYTDSVVLTILP